MSRRLGRVESLGLVHRLRRQLEALYGNRLRGVYLYGSCARDEDEEGSDVDVLIVLSDLASYWDELQRTSETAAQQSLETGVSVSLVFVTEDAWQSAETAFLSNVRQEAIAA